MFGNNETHANIAFGLFTWASKGVHLLPEEIEGYVEFNVSRFDNEGG